MVVLVFGAAYFTVTLVGVYMQSVRMRLFDLIFVFIFSMLCVAQFGHPLLGGSFFLPMVCW